MLKSSIRNVLSVILFLVTTTSYATESKVTTMFPVEEVVVTEDAVLVWYIRPSKGKQVKNVVLHQGTINGPVLWYNHMKNDPDMPEVDESLYKLKQRFGDRATVKWTPVVNWITLKIKNVSYNDTMTFVLRVSFKKTNDVLAHEFDHQEIRLEVKGVKFIGDGLASLYKFKEGTEPTFSLLVVAKPPPIITWKFGGDPKAGDAEMEESNKELFLYKYSYTLKPLEIEDCGKNLAFVAKDNEGEFLYKSLTNQYQKAKIIVLFTPEKVEGVAFHGMAVADLYCHQFRWDPIAAGQCGDQVTYTVEITNGTDVLTFGNVSNTFFRICDANAATKFGVHAVFEGNSGPQTTIDLYEEPTTPTPAPALPINAKCPPIPKIEPQEVSNGFTIVHLIIMFIIGFVVAIIIETIVVVIYIKKKYPSDEGDGEEQPAADADGV